MRILMVTNALSEGGVETLLLDLCRSLVNLYHHDVAVLVLKKNEIGLKKQFEECGIKIFAGKYGNIYNPLNIFLIRNYIQWCQIIHVHLFPGQLFAVLAKLFCVCSKKAPYITTEHNTFNNRRKFSCLKLLDRYIYSKYDDVICISRQTELNLRQWLGRKSVTNIRTIENGIDIEKFQKASNKLNEYIQSSYDIQYLVMVGRFEYPKDQATLIRTMKYLPTSIHLVLVGSGSNMASCKELADIEGVTERIHFLGNCIDVPSILKGCKIGILSTKWDGFGLVAVEYMATGIPVIASDVDGLRDVVGNEKLLFRVGDAKGLSEKILGLLNDIHTYQDAREYCTVMAQNYSIQRMVGEYLLVYQKVLR